MPDYQEQSWSDNPNAPNIPYRVYFAEKTWFAGTLISAILYGMLIVLAVKCAAALFNPLNRRDGGIRWGIVSYTMVMFSLATLHIATKAHILSISYIDNRDFPGVDRQLYPGPFGYQAAIPYKGISIVPIASFRLSNWSADGLLLYRCYVFYSGNLWVVGFPFLMFLGSVATGILSICLEAARYRLTTMYISLSLSLNVLLTFMIVVRLVLRGRRIRAAMGSPAGISRLYKSIATMLVESSALFAVNSLLVIGTWAAKHPVANVFTRTLAETQVLASLLIIQRVANKSTLTSNTIAPGSISPFKTGSQGELTSHGGSGALPGGYYMSSTGERGTSSGNIGVTVETAVDFHRDMV